MDSITKNTTTASTPAIAPTATTSPAPDASTADPNKISVRIGRPLTEEEFRLYCKKNPSVKLYGKNL